MEGIERRFLMGVLADSLTKGLKAPPKGIEDLWTIESGKDKLVVGGKIQFDQANNLVFIPNTIAGLTYDQIWTIAMVIDELSYAATTYGNIVNHRLFQQLYQRGQRPVAYVKGTTFSTQSEDTFPCQICGIVLPASCIDIDHIRPKKGGELEAVAKVLRTLDLTVKGPTGQKSPQLQSTLQLARLHQQGMVTGLNSFMNSGLLTAVPTRVGRAPKIQPTSSLGDRYSLNWQGFLFYTVVKSLGSKTELEVRSMNSMINLRPLCGHCNSSRQNPLKF
jgi:hypothetical protein